jgi:hypothetical protein
MATYTQDWSAGNSANFVDGTYRRDVNGVDGLYPEFWVANGVNVGSGKLTPNTTYDPSQQGAGITLAPGNADGLGHPDNLIDALSAQQGSVTVKMIPNSLALVPSANGLYYAPVVEIFASNALRNLVFVLYSEHAAPFADKGAPFFWELSARNRNSGVLENFVFGDPAPTFVAGQENTFKVCWKCGTWNGVTTDLDGYVKWYLDGALVYEELNFPLVLNNNLSVNNAKHGWIALGSDTVNDGGGMFGEMGEFSISDSECPTTRQAVIFGRGAAADDKATVTSDLTVLMNLDELGRTVHEPNTLYVAGDMIVTGTTTFEGDVVASSPETLINSIVTTGSEIVLDSDGNIVYVNGS